MYTVFINEKTLILTYHPFQFDKDTKIIAFKKTDFFFKSILDLLNQKKNYSICVYYNDLDFLWNNFQNTFKTIEAAGGVVKNRLGQILFIKRLGVWDLPKGKIEKNESCEEAAIREVEEECHIFGLKILKPLPTTYHIYYDKNQKPVLKIVYWYEMLCEEEYQHLIPQIEEDIEEVVWKDSAEIQSALKNTYQNIKLLFKEVMI
ncbi:MAG: NUDIX hydrolase [Flavobacteriales bacterium]